MRCPFTNCGARILGNPNSLGSLFEWYSLFRGAAHLKRTHRIFLGCIGYVVRISIAFRIFNTWILPNTYHDVVIHDPPVPVNRALDPSTISVFTLFSTVSGTDSKKIGEREKIDLVVFSRIGHWRP